MELEDKFACRKTQSHNTQIVESTSASKVRKRLSKQYKQKRIKNMQKPSRKQDIIKKGKLPKSCVIPNRYDVHSKNGISEWL